MSEELRYELTLYPSPLLRRPCPPVEKFDAELKGILEGMYERMHASQGVGLAAPQVGIRQRILVLSHTGKAEDQLALINPTITKKFGEATCAEEGCLSFPEIYAEVTRPDSCTVKAFTPEGKQFERTFEGFESRIIQHEYDHLEGVLLVDRMSGADKQRNKPALQALVDDYKRAVAAEG
jgi:peptide deformylase